MNSAAGTIAVLGDALLDVDLRGTSHRDCPDAPAPVVEDAAARHRPGGAALAAHRAARGGRAVTLVTGLGRDAAAETLAGVLGARVRLVGLPMAAGTPTKTRIMADGRTVARVDGGGGRIDGAVDLDAVAGALAGADAVLVSDYGRGLTSRPEVRDLLAACAERVPLVWDPHPRGAPPVPGAWVVTPNAAEAGVEDGDPGAALERAAHLARTWRARCVAVTLGEDGAVRADPRGEGERVRAVPAAGGSDPCGAGDAFAAACAAALADGRGEAAAVRVGVAAASEFVAGGGAGAFAPEGERGPEALGALTGAAGALSRRGGERLVATGGCFDILHAGHVELLRYARRLGDRLVVLLNSDASVRALKGEGRPVVGEADRARLLAALDCVDGVRIFDDPTPVRELARLRPDVWVKGGDYEASRMPETPVVRSWGGDVVTVPLIPGRSTTGIITRIRGREAVS
ncbi:PfkB family carbohydrate kinase [Nocardiopsis sp. NPDC006139]|uniref:PfkB family carbohydrate kinase n=1 Tax=Nocardiopsis sp. NPDC006139 TaxID=3154578 RepID=UPI0033A5A6D7